MRAFNHIGPGQPTGFVVPDFCNQIAKIEAGLISPEILTGNLDVSRDFTDVRDIVRGYLLALELGANGEIYNIGSGRSVYISKLLKILIKLSNAFISVKQDPEKYRPIDTPAVQASVDKLRVATGFAPEIPLEKSLEDTLNFYRRKYIYTPNLNK
jgi:GDP-4-dehydro-6-deoxy-D-mannose reductase